MYIFVGVLSEVFFSVPGHGGFSPSNNGVWDGEAKRALVWGSGHEKWQITTENDAAEFTAELVLDLTKGTGTYRFCSYEKSTREMAQVYEEIRGIKVTLDHAGSLDDLRDVASTAVEELGPKGFWEWMGYFYQIFQLDGTVNMNKLDNSCYPEVQATSLEDFLRLHTEI